MSFFQRATTMGRTTAAPTYGADPYWDFGTMRDQTMTAAPTFPPFKFEPKRARIDWRLLHGVDITAMVRDVDLDTLERIVNIVAYGDIEAEDTRHLTELNFIKIFRLAQMMIEYLLYVQECLQNSNSWMQQDRTNMDKYVQAARLRIRELDANMKMTKRELRRARKTIKTYEMLAVINDGKGKDRAAETAATAVATAPPPAPPPPVAPKAPEPNPMATAMEALLRKELAVLAERLSRATVEAQQLRSERDEMYQAIKDVDAAVKARADADAASSKGKMSMEAMVAMQNLQEQLNRANGDIAKLRDARQDLSDELDRAKDDRRQLQEEKTKLLAELAARPLQRNSELGGTGPDHLSSMLLDAERQKESLQEQLTEAKEKITQLEKQLMKAMKATALAPLGGMPAAGSGGGGGDEPGQLRAALRDAESAKSQLEKDLVELRRTYNTDVQQLQEELELTQAKAVEADHKLAEMRAAASAPSMGTARMAVRPTHSGGAGGFIKVTEERRRDDEEDTDDRRGVGSQGRLSDYEAMNERLNQQIMQLKEERNTLAGDVERLRAQLEGRGIKPAAPDPSINRDWKTEEMERLRNEAGSAKKRCAELEQMLVEREAQVERLRSTIRDLQAQLDERNRTLASDPSLNRVRQQVQEYERFGGAPTGRPPQHTKVASFSFIPDVTMPDDKSSDATPKAVQQPSRPPLPRMQPPSPPQPGDGRALQGKGSRWLRRAPRPAPSEIPVLRHNILSHVAGMRPEQLEMKLAEEIRVVTENPYEFEDDDEAKFRALLPHELLPERPGVLSVKPHVLEDLETAHRQYTEELLDAVDDEMYAAYGIDPTVGERMSDKDYAANMLELASRRSLLMDRYPKEVQERAETLRDAILTHLELAKRGMQQQQMQQQQQLLLQEQQEQQRQQQERQEQLRAQQQAAAALAAAAAAEIAPAAASVTAAEGGSLPRPALQQSSQSAAFVRQQSARVSGASGSDVDDLRSMLPPPSLPAAGPSGRALAVDAAGLGASGRGLNASMNRSLPRGGGGSGANLNASITSIGSSASRMHHNAQQRVTPAAAAPSGGPILVGAGRVSGPGAAGPSTAAAVSQAAGIHPFNMSSRSKYQESDFDDEDEPPPPPQPRAITRVTKEDDEYALTEDEETLQDEGIAESDSEASPAGPQPKLILRTGATSPPRAPVAQQQAPSRLGSQRTPAVAASKGWATDEPLLPAPQRKRSSGPEETTDMESIRSFNDTMSQSLPRQPRAWGSPSTTLRKQAPQMAKVQQEQFNTTGKSGWNESIQSFGPPSGAGDEIQNVQDISSLQSFSDSIRPVRTSQGGMAARPGQMSGPPARAGAQQAAARQQLTKRGSSDTDITDIDYL